MSLYLRLILMTSATEGQSPLALPPWQHTYRPAVGNQEHGTMLFVFGGETMAEMTYGMEEAMIFARNQPPDRFCELWKVRPLTPPRRVPYQGRVLDFVVGLSLPGNHFRAPTPEARRAQAQDAVEQWRADRMSLDLIRAIGTRTSVTSPATWCVDSFVYERRIR